MTAQQLVRRAAAVMALVVVMPLGVASAAGRPDVEGTAAKPTIVFVHGAWADASGWAAVTERLQDQGYTVIALANPLRGVPSDAAYLTSVLATISGPIVLVGHSYGGAVITNAATGNPNVKALVFIAAFAPDAGHPAAAGYRGPRRTLRRAGLEDDPVVVSRRRQRPCHPSGHGTVHGQACRSDDPRGQLVTRPHDLPANGRDGPHRRRGPPRRVTKTPKRANGGESADRHRREEGLPRRGGEGRARG
jgi:pimeloyl-ACP methyl ester carboxylesterase